MITFVRRSIIFLKILHFASKIIIRIVAICCLRHFRLDAIKNSDIDIKREEINLFLRYLIHCIKRIYLSAGMLFLVDSGLMIVVYDQK